MIWVWVWVRAAGLARRARAVGSALTSTGFDADTQTMTDLFTKYGLEAGTQDFIGHAMALWLDDA